MLWVYGHYKFLVLSARGSTLESDVCRRQILTSKSDPRTERVKIEFRGEAEQSMLDVSQLMTCDHTTDR